MDYMLIARIMSVALFSAYLHAGNTKIDYAGHQQYIDGARRKMKEDGRVLNIPAYRDGNECYVIPEDQHRVLSQFGRWAIARTV